MRDERIDKRTEGRMDKQKDGQLDVWRKSGSRKSSDEITRIVSNELGREKASVCLVHEPSICRWALHRFIGRRLGPSTVSLGLGIGSSSGNNRRYPTIDPRWGIRRRGIFSSSSPVGQFPSLVLSTSVCLWREWILLACLFHSSRLSDTTIRHLMTTTRKYLWCIYSNHFRTLERYCNAAT